MNTYPTLRMRRLRGTTSIRSLLTETVVSLNDIIKPVFIVPGTNIKKEINSLPGQFQLSIDEFIIDAKKSFGLGIKALLLFGIPEYKDDTGSSSLSDDGIIQKALREVKKEIPELLIITDLCFCEYTSHGHCGIIKDTYLDNDETLKILKLQALSHVRNGADIIAPSGMIDGTVVTLRKCLDENGFGHIPIMNYSTKFASSFYGPFREAVNSSPSFGDRNTYQMNPANSREAVRESLIDIQEGADMIIIKPALAYLDIIKEIKSRSLVPVVAYHVSGEYAMIKATGKLGWIDEEKCMLEVLTSIKRAGADLIITYFADQFANYCTRNSVK